MCLSYLTVGKEGMLKLTTYNKKQRAQYYKTMIPKTKTAEGDKDVDRTEVADGTENNGVGDGGDKHKHHSKLCCKKVRWQEV